MKHLKFIPSEEVCTKAIEISLEEEKIKELSFAGGCDGNLKDILDFVKIRTQKKL